MIEYEAGSLGIFFAFSLRGSVLPKSFGFAVVCAALTVFLHWILSETGQKDSFDIGSKGTTVVSMFTFVLGFLLVFRTQQAYSRWWEGGSLLQELRGEWFNAYSCLLAFGNTAPEKKMEVQKFNHQLARMVSMLHGASLAQVCSMNVKQFEVLDLEDFDVDSLAFLDTTWDSTEVALQWVQRLIGEADERKTIKVAPPILSRVYNQLGSGIVKLSRARKIAKFPIPFPFAQMVTIMLLTHWIMAAIVCATSIESRVWSGVLSFAVVISFWSMNYIALELEDPFGDDANDLPLLDMQSDLNSSLCALLAAPAMAPPDFDFNSAYHGELNIKVVDFNKRLHKSAVAIYEQRPKDAFQQAERRKAKKDGSYNGLQTPCARPRPTEPPPPQLIAASAPSTPACSPSQAPKGTDLFHVNSGTLVSPTAIEHLRVCKAMEQQLSRAVELLERNGSHLERSVAQLQRNGSQLERNGSQLRKNCETQTVLYQLHCDFWGLLTNVFQRIPPHTPQRTPFDQSSLGPESARGAKSELQPILADQGCTGSSSFSEYVAVDVHPVEGSFSIY